MHTLHFNERIIPVKIFYIGRQPTVTYPSEVLDFLAAEGLNSALMSSDNKPTRPAVGIFLYTQRDSGEFELRAFTRGTAAGICGTILTETSSTVKNSLNSLGRGSSSREASGFKPSRVLTMPGIYHMHWFYNTTWLFS